MLKQLMAMIGVGALVIALSTPTYAHGRSSNYHNDRNSDRSGEITISNHDLNVTVTADALSVTGENVQVAKAEGTEPTGNCFTFFCPPTTEDGDTTQSMTTGQALTTSLIESVDVGMTIIDADCHCSLDGDLTITNHDLDARVTADADSATGGNVQVRRGSTHGRVTQAMNTGATSAGSHVISASVGYTEFTVGQ